MTSSNLRTFDNLYANLAQSAYTGRPSIFPYNSQREIDKDLLDSGQSLPFIFSKDTEFYNTDTKNLETTLGGKDLPIGAKLMIFYLKKGQTSPAFSSCTNEKITSFGIGILSRIMV